MLSIVGGKYRVLVGEKMLEASLRGRFKHASKRRVLVGDVVELATHGDHGVTIEDVAERRSVLQRRTPGKSRGLRAVAANVDQVIVVGSARDPMWDPHMMDRFVVVAEANHLPVIVIVNKADLVDNPDPLGQPYRMAGYNVMVSSATTGSGIDEVKGALLGKTSLLTGSTGVGKSSLLNAIQPGLGLRTAEVSRRGRVGRHTTVSVEMYPLDGGGFVVDTPGLRDVGLWAVDPPEVAAAFPEFAAFLNDCRFDDCRHLQEPGCAVKAAAAAGKISETRLDSYRKILGEAVESSRAWE
ncbi:MAG: ribosome small subunit-dependent GTPase A [Gemmatimonadetes bacterium]|nr:ribosome small subunit-dependent GTPase A [Gemmatimonadota bacterium]